MTGSLGNQVFYTAVVKELIFLRETIPIETLQDKLVLSSYNGKHDSNCIYGLLTGDAHSKTSTKLRENAAQYAEYMPDSREFYFRSPKGLPEFSDKVEWFMEHSNCVPYSTDFYRTLLEIVMFWFPNGNKPMMMEIFQFLKHETDTLSDELGTALDSIKYYKYKSIKQTKMATPTKITQTKANFIRQATKEIMGLKTNLTQDEKSKLDFATFRPVLVGRDVYGQATGDSRSERALELKTLCADMSIAWENYPIPTESIPLLEDPKFTYDKMFNIEPMVVNGKPEEHFTAFEYYMEFAPKPVMEGVYAYLKDETDSLPKELESTRKELEYEQNKAKETAVSAATSALVEADI